MYFLILILPLIPIEKFQVGETVITMIQILAQSYETCYISTVDYANRLISLLLDKWHAARFTQSSKL